MENNDSGSSRLPFAETGSAPEEIKEETAGDAADGSAPSPETETALQERPGEIKEETAEGNAAEGSAPSPETETALQGKPGEVKEETAGDAGVQAPVDPEELEAALEAILFAMGEAVPIDSLAAALGVSTDTAGRAVDGLAERCRRKNRGLTVNWYEDAVQLSTKPEYYGQLIRIASEPKKPKLTPTLMETLSIIAFRQPVTRMEVENIRGVNSDFAISRLVSFDLVREVGRKEVPGRPLLFGTTEQFLRSFGIRSVDELPEPDPGQMEAFREEAEEEITSRLNV